MVMDPNSVTSNTPLGKQLQIKSNDLFNEESDYINFAESRQLILSKAKIMDSNLEKQLSKWVNSFLKYMNYAMERQALVHTGPRFSEIRPFSFK